MIDAATPQRPRHSTGPLFCLRGATALFVCVLAVPCFADDAAVSDEGNEPAAGEPDAESPVESVVPFWQLEQGQTFLTTTNIRRETELHVGDVIRNSDETDRIELAYGVSVPDRVGGFRVGVRVLSMRRVTKNGDTDSGQIEVLPKRDLTAMAMTCRVSDGGEHVVPYPGASLVPTHDLESRELLARLCGPDVFRSWIDLPYRVPVITNQNQLIPPRILQQPETDPPDSEEGPEEKAAPDEIPGLKAGFTWKRPQHVSLGFLGTLRMDCEYRVDSIADDTATIAIQGTAVIEPLDSPARSMLTIESVDLSASEISGGGTVAMNRLSAVPDSMRFEQRIAVEGTGVVRSGKQSHDVRIKQLLTQEWIVSEFQYRDEPQGFPIPMVR